jgi:hypothetical protein
LAIVQEQHDIAVALQIKELEIRDRDADALVTAAQSEGEGDAEEKSAALFHVRRGGAWMRADRARTRPGHRFTLHCLPGHAARKAPVFDFRAASCHSALMETHASASDSAPTPRRAKSDFLLVQ